VSATNRTAAKAQPLIERGLAWISTAREVAASTDVVLSMVTDDEALEAIATGSDGLLAGVRAGQVYVDMRTVSPQASRQLAERLAARGAHMLDARSPAASRRPRAEPSRSWSAVTPHAFAAVEPLLRELGRAVAHVGPTARAWCSSSRSTSASRCRRSPSAKGCCSPNAPASILTSPPRS
jgi:3-hydroxyisobutyrate dehydrogenase-like beta-hydroxyacid dehydrogenase